MSGCDINARPQHRLVVSWIAGADLGSRGAVDAGTVRVRMHQPTPINIDRNDLEEVEVAQMHRGVSPSGAGGLGQLDKCGRRGYTPGNGTAANGGGLQRRTHKR